MNHEPSGPTGLLPALASGAATPDGPMAVATSAALLAGQPQSSDSRPGRGRYTSNPGHAAQ